MLKSHQELPIDENFEKWWEENGVKTKPAILGIAFKEVARNAWEACKEILQNVKSQESA